MSLSFQKNTELEIFRAHTNGFGDEGGKMLINSLKVNHILKEVDLSNNRLTDAFIKMFTFNLNEMQGVTVLKVNCLPYSTFLAPCALNFFRVAANF